jgi:hypothetical protein
VIVSARAHIATGPLPPFALLERYRGADGYSDCFSADIPGEFSHAEFVAAFYTTGLFRLERLILGWLAARPSTDEEARQLARGQRESFAAWTVEARAPNQILLCDFLKNTRSWLMVEPRPGGGLTRLYFGSAIVARARRVGRRRLGLRFRALLGFHRRYSRALLRAAHARLTAGLT